MRLYVMRHGTTNWNEKKIIQGRRHNRLSKSGVKLVENTAYEIKDIDFDVIISSPMFRTIQTANIVNKYHNCKIIKNELLSEIDRGKFSGRPYNKLTENEKFLFDTIDKNSGMEQAFDVYKRANSFVNEVLPKYKNQTVLIVTHDIIASFIEIILTNKQDTYDINKYTPLFKNAEVKCFEVNI